MKKILEKEVCGVKIVIAVNDNGELKLGSEEAYNLKRMPAFIPEGWYPIGMDFLHVKEEKDGLYCNFGADLPVENNDFPYKMLELEELNLISTILQR